MGISTHENHVDAMARRIGVALLLPLQQSLDQHALVGEGFELPSNETTKGWFLRRGKIRTTGLEAQSGSLIGCSSSCGITMMDSSDCLNGHNVKLRRVGFQIQLSWCKFGEDLIDLFFLSFLLVASALKVILTSLSHICSWSPSLCAI